VFEEAIVDRKYGDASRGGEGQQERLAGKANRVWFDIFVAVREGGHIISVGFRNRALILPLILASAEVQSRDFSRTSSLK
jgi:hypothetical protein